MTWTGVYKGFYRTAVEIWSTYRGSRDILAWKSFRIELEVLKDRLSCIVRPSKHVMVSYFLI